MAVDVYETAVVAVGHFVIPAVALAKSRAYPYFVVAGAAKKPVGFAFSASPG